MERRKFLKNGLMLFIGGSVLNTEEVMAKAMEAHSAATKGPDKSTATGLYKLFTTPENDNYPFVRWWWNGDKVEEPELKRELGILKDACVGGVEINPISFPAPSITDDLGKKSFKWLSDEWMDMLQVTFDEAKRLGVTCDLIVGSGWPFGSEELPLEERAQVAIVNAIKLEGPQTYECSPYSLALEVDPGVTLKNPRRTSHIMALKLAKQPMGSLDDVTDFSSQIGQEIYKIDVPAGTHYLYTLIRYESFAEVINGAPGAAGSILNHMDPKAVKHYLDNMADKIQNKLGPLSNNIRALFTDSMELEGNNWSNTFADEFKKRNGYDLMPYLPFIMFEVGRLGDVKNFKYGADKSPEFEDVINRVRYDFEFTKASIYKEYFSDVYTAWCRSLGVKSRAQSYGRGFFPLESSLDYDIPEGESWTTNWLRHVIGEEMSDEDYRRGRGYTMIDKYVSSAAHLTGKRLVSCEEMTNTYNVFNATLEYLKVGSDMSAQSGITHSVWHGFNYSPAEAPFPGWIQYGSYYNEKNSWWPYFKYLNTYRARLCSQLQNADMYTDIAILPPNADMWSTMGVQTEPFPVDLNVRYTSIIWESINKCGGAADYTSEIILNDSMVKEGKLCYGPKKYGVLILPEVQSIQPSTMEKIYNFVQQGGKVFCIEKLPEKAPGLYDHELRDKLVKSYVEKLKNYPERFVLIPKPEDKKYLEWYMEWSKKYNMPHYMEIENPERFVMQTRYIRDDKSEFYFFTNSHRHESRKVKVKFTSPTLKGKNPWLWDIDTGKRYRLTLDAQKGIEFDMGPSDSFLVVFDKATGGEKYAPLPVTGANEINLDMAWDVEFCNPYENSSVTKHFDKVHDLITSEDTKHFAGTAKYRKKINVDTPDGLVLNLGKVEGVSEVFVNGKSLGVKWFGRRIHDLSKVAKAGENTIEVHVTTTMGNYLKSLKDNEIATRWVNRKGREQAYYSQGIIGPVTLYKK